MRLLYRDGQNLCLAELTKITCSGAMLVCQLACTDKKGLPEQVIRPLPSAELCERFFRDVVCTTAPDGIINLEHTNLDTRLGAMFSEFDALFEE